MWNAKKQGLQMRVGGNELRAGSARIRTKMDIKPRNQANGEKRSVLLRKRESRPAPAVWAALAQGAMSGREKQ